MVLGLEIDGRFENRCISYKLVFSLKADQQS